MATTAARPDTRRRIVDAAARLLQEHGPAAVTTRAVAEGAGVQAPTIYRQFGDKDGLLDAVAEHVMATFVAAKATTVAEADAAGVDPVDDLRAGWDTYVDFGLANPTLFVLLTDPARSETSGAARSGLEVLARRIHHIARAGRLRVPETRAVELVHAAGVGVVLTLLATPALRRDRAVADDLLTAVLARILTDGPPTPLDGVGAAAVALRAGVAVRSGVADADVLSDAERVLLTEWLDRIAAR